MTDPLVVAFLLALYALPVVLLFAVLAAVADFLERKFK